MVYWICVKCGKEYGSVIPQCATFHEGQCEICKKKAVVTESRDYGYTDFDKTKKIYNNNLIKKL